VTDEEVATDDEVTALLEVAELVEVTDDELLDVLVAEEVATELLEELDVFELDVLELPPPQVTNCH
jgi:hypothetical protein